MEYEPTGSGEAVFTEKRSRFIAYVQPATNADQAHSHVNQHKLDHPNASHVVYAFLIGPTNSRTAGMSDAGEPSGTAGRPVMDVLAGSGLTDAVVSVVRYFGGTKLGKGGLVRAYGEAAKLALETTPKRQRIERSEISAIVPYECIDSVERLLAEYGANVVFREYQTKVALRAEVPSDRLAELSETIRNTTAGRVIIDPYRQTDTPK
jgi:uncharacterized YigZ family protein